MPYPKLFGGGNTQSINGMSQSGNLAGSLALVHGTLSGSLGQYRCGLGKSFTGGSLVMIGNGDAHSLHCITGFGTGGTVSASANKTLTMTLKSGLMVSHDNPPD